MKIKPGVKIDGIKSEILIAWTIADGIYKQSDFNCVVTSCTEEKEHKDYSDHYLGYAIDLRTRYFPNRGFVNQIASQLKDALGDCFLVRVEYNHIHIAYRPRQG